MKLETVVKVTTSSALLLATNTIARLLWSIASYQWKRLRSDYDKIPWIWEGSTNTRTWLWTIMPALMKFSKTGGILELNRVLIDPVTKKYKPVVFSGASIGFDPTVMIGDSRSYGLIFNDPVGFPKYEPMYKLYKTILGSGLVISKGATHKTQRKLITPVFHFGALKSAGAILQKNATLFIEVELPSRGYVLSRQTFKVYTLNVIIDYAFSGAFDKPWMSSTWKNIVSFFPVHNLLRIFVGDIVTYIPNPINIRMLLMRRKIMAYLAERRRLLASRNITQEIVLAAVAAGDTAASDTAAAGNAAAGNAGDIPGQGQCPPPGPSWPNAVSIDLGMNLADQLLLAGCPDAQIADECTTFMFAGEDTTSSLLAWVAYELSRVPAEQALLRAELADVLGPGPIHAVPVEVIPCLPRLSAVIKETLRLWPPVGIVMRENRRPDLVIGGFRIPIGASLDLSVRAAHRDPEVWPEPDAFRPARWLLPPDSEEAARRHPYSFTPFLAGPRNCIGQRFAMQEAAVMLAMLLSRPVASRPQTTPPCTELAVAPPSWLCWVSWPGGDAVSLSSSSAWRGTDRARRGCPLYACVATRAWAACMRMCNYRRRRDDDPGPRSGLARGV